MAKQATEDQTGDSGATATAEKAPRVKTPYVVLELDAESGHYKVLGDGEGLNDVQAIGSVIGERDDEATFVGVPKRSFKHRSVSVETKRSVRVK